MADRPEAAGWYQDPSGRHELRYHDGATFGAHVSDHGVVTVDPVEVQLPAPPTYGYGGPASPYGGGFPPWGYARAPLSPPAATRRRVGMWVATGIAILEAVAILALAVALVAARSAPSTSSAPIGTTVGPSGSFSQSMGSVVYSSNFGTNEGWDTGSLTANSNATLTDNHYVVTGWTEIHHALLTPYGVAHRAISVATTVENYPAGDVSMGAGCQSAYGISPALVYQMVVYPDGQWYIEEARVSGGVQTLLSGGTSALGAAASVQLTCVITATTSTTETTQLVGYVNGIRVGAIGDQTDQNPIGGYVPVLMLGTFGPTESATFTGITVRSITPSG